MRAARSQQEPTLACASLAAFWSGTTRGLAAVRLLFCWQIAKALAQRRSLLHRRVAIHVEPKRVAVSPRGTLWNYAVRITVTR
jgi:hypothetical protein